MDSLGKRGPIAISPDEGLIRRARAGDVGAFDALIATRVDRCYRLAWSILGSDADAADAAQEAFVAAWRELPRLRATSSFDGWLNRIVANSARMSRRHRGRLREVHVPEIGGDGGTSAAREDRADPTAHAEIDRVAESDAIGRAFDRLRPDDRLILTLHHVEEQPVREIARSLGIPLGTAKWRLHAARGALERALEAES